MTSPYLFDNDIDYYDSLLTPAQRKVNDICENDPVQYIIDHGLTDDLINTYWDQIFDYLVDRDFVYQYLLEYVEENERLNKEP